jgi:hypothetical protein
LHANRLGAVTFHTKVGFQLFFLLKKNKNSLITNCNKKKVKSTLAQ